MPYKACHSNVDHIHDRSNYLSSSVMLTYVCMTSTYRTVYSRALYRTVYCSPMYRTVYCLYNVPYCVLRNSTLYRTVGHAYSNRHSAMDDEFDF